MHRKRQLRKIIIYLSKFIHVLKKNQMPNIKAFADDNFVKKKKLNKNIVSPI